MLAGALGRSKPLFSFQKMEAFRHTVSRKGHRWSASEPLLETDIPLPIDFSSHDLGNRLEIRNGSRMGAEHTTRIEMTPQTENQAGEKVSEKKREERCLEPFRSHLADGVAITIDGEIFQDAWLEPIPPESEVHVIPQIVGG